MWTLLSPAPTTRVLSCAQEQTADWTGGCYVTWGEDDAGGQTDPVVDGHGVDLRDLQTGPEGGEGSEHLDEHITRCVCVAGVSPVVRPLGPQLLHVLRRQKTKPFSCSSWSILLLLYSLVGHAQRSAT